MLPQNLLRFGVVLALAGMVMGMAMGVTQNFALVGAHAHLNLVGFVIPFLTGLYYQASPDAARTRLASVQMVLAMLGGVFFPAGVAAVILGGRDFLPVVAVTAVVVLSSVALLAVLVFRHGLSPAPRRDGGAATASSRA